VASGAGNPHLDMQIRLRGKHRELVLRKYAMGF